MSMIDFTQYLPQRIFLVQGDTQTYEALVADVERNYEIVHGLSVPRFTIDHAHTIASFALEGDGTARMLLVYFTVFSPDAAQVLLKSLEEPDEQTTIVFITPYPYVVPTTIRSRVMVLHTDTENVDTKRITKVSALAFIKDELSSESDEDAATRRANAIAFLDQLEVQMKGKSEKSRTIYEAKRMLFRANMPTKYVLEWAVSSVL